MFRPIGSITSTLKAQLLLFTFVGIIAGGTAAWWSVPQSARAADCSVPPFNTLATKNSTPANFNSFGTRATNPGIQVFSGGAVCERVSSLFAFSEAPHLDGAEVGWLNIASGQTGCNGTPGDGQPHVFYVYVISGSLTCKVVTGTQYSLSPGSYYPFSVRLNFSTSSSACFTQPFVSSSCDWIFDFNGNIMKQATLDFGISTPAANGERHSTDSNEIAHAIFDGLQYRNSSGVLIAWEQSLCWVYYDNDPDFRNHLFSATHVEMNQQPAQCSY